MKPSNAILNIVSAVFLSGCATAQLDNLYPVNEKKGMLITEPISFVFGSSAIMLSGVQAGLLPGYYAATKENDNGTFYLGAGQCIWYKGDKEYGVITGGIWLPKNSNNPARLFSVIGEPSVKVKVLQEAPDLCRQPKASDESEGLTGTDLQAVLLANPNAIGVRPSGPNGMMSGTQLAGGLIGFAIAQAAVESAKGEYQVLQKVEDSAALTKMAEGVQLADRTLKKHRNSVSGSTPQN